MAKSQRRSNYEIRKPEANTKHTALPMMITAWDFLKKEESKQ